jgi:hypothetical protein
MERMRLRGSMPTQGPMQAPGRPGVQPLMQPLMPPLLHGQVRCPRCSASAPGAAAFCPHCGLALNSLPPPILQGQVAQRGSRSGLLFLIYILLGVMGLAAFAWWRSGGWDEERMATPAPPPHVRMHEYHYQR